MKLSCALFPTSKPLGSPGHGDGRPSGPSMRSRLEQNDCEAFIGETTSHGRALIQLGDNSSVAAGSLAHLSMVVNLTIWFDRTTRFRALQQPCFPTEWPPATS